MNFFKLYIGDYQRDTGTLTLAEHGAYLLMLQQFYATEKPLPRGRELYRLLRCESAEERLAVDAVALKFWTETDGGLVSSRGLDEIAKYDHQRSINRKIGKLGGRPKKTDSLTEAITESVIEHEPILQPNRNPIQILDLKNKTKKEKDKKQQEAQAPCFSLPNWVPVDAWEGWLEMRAKQRKYPTERAKVLAIADLDRLRHAGHDPGAVLDQSTQNGWTGLFQRRGNNNGKDSGYNKGRGQRIADKLDAIAREAYEREGGIVEQLDDSDI